MNKLNDLVVKRYFFFFLNKSSLLYEDNVNLCRICGEDKLVRMKMISGYVNV